MSGESRPLFSIITVVRNAVGTVGECISSVENQSFRDFEYIVIDGLSDDGTSELISSHLHGINKYVREKDAGIYDAMNKAISLSSGKYIGIINADDAYFYDTLTKVKGFITQFPKSEIIYGGVQVLNEKSSTLFVDHSDLSSAMIAHPSCFVSSEVYERIGTFDSSFRIASDYDFMLRARAAGVVFQNSGLLLAKYRPGGASARFRITAIREMIDIQARHLGWNKLYRTFRLVKYLGATFLRAKNRRN